MFSQGLVESTEQVRSARAGDKLEGREEEIGQAQSTSGSGGKEKERKALKTLLSPQLSLITNSSIPQNNDRDRPFPSCLKPLF